VTCLHLRDWEHHQFGVGISKAYQNGSVFDQTADVNLTGTATLPSQVDVYVDGVSLAAACATGQFELRNLNYYGGTRNVKLVVKDAFGMEQGSIIEYFTSSFETGASRIQLQHRLLRQQYGIIKQ